MTADSKKDYQQKSVDQMLPNASLCAQCTVRPFPENLRFFLRRKRIQRPSEK